MVLFLGATQHVEFDETGQALQMGFPLQPDLLELFPSFGIDLKTVHGDVQGIGSQGGWMLLGR